MEPGMTGTIEERLGAHVSTQGGVATAPARGVAIGATAIQLFTKTPNQWRDPSIDAARPSSSSRGRQMQGILGQWVTSRGIA